MSANPVKWSISNSTSSQHIGQLLALDTMGHLKH